MAKQSTVAKTQEPPNRKSVASHPCCFFPCSWGSTRCNTQASLQPLTLMQELRTQPLPLFFLSGTSCPQEVPPCDLLSNSQVVLGNPFFHKYKPNSPVLRGHSNIRLESVISFVLFLNWYIPWVGKRGCCLFGSFKDPNHLNSVTMFFFF